MTILYLLLPYFAVFFSAANFYFSGGGKVCPKRGTLYSFSLVNSGGKKKEVISFPWMKKRGTEEIRKFFKIFYISWKTSRNTQKSYKICIRDTRSIWILQSFNTKMYIFIISLLLFLNAIKKNKKHENICTTFFALNFCPWH